MRLSEGAPSVPVRSGIALLAGVLLALSMPPVTWWPLVFVAVAVLALVCRGASLPLGALLGGLFGFAFVLVCMWWLQVIVPGIQFAIAVAELPFFALLGLAMAATSRLRGWPMWAACCWLGVETFRSAFPFGGLPWGRLGMTVAETPVAAWARYAGEAGLTLVVALVATLLAAAVVARGRSRVLPVLGAALLLACSTLLPVELQGTPGHDVTVAVVQGDVPGSGLDAFFQPEVTLRNHVEATLDLAADVRAGQVERPDVVIWPENASDVDPLLDAAAGDLVQQAVDAVGVPVVVGAVTLGSRPDEVQGSGIVWRPGLGPGQRYTKRRLVPFGEFVPFRPALTPLVPLLEEEIPRDFVPGRRPGVLQSGDVTVGAVMCFEVAYDAAIREVSPPEVDLLAVQTNNANYLGTGQLEQQWAITRLRAIETGRAVAVAATTGISGVVAPDGSVLERTHSRFRQTILAQVPAGEGQTPGIRWGLWVGVVGSAVGAASVAASLLRRAGRGRRG